MRVRFEQAQFFQAVGGHPGTGDVLVEPAPAGIPAVRKVPFRLVAVAEGDVLHVHALAIHIQGDGRLRHAAEYAHAVFDIRFGNDARIAERIRHLHLVIDVGGVGRIEIHVDLAERHHHVHQVKCIERIEIGDPVAYGVPEILAPFERIVHGYAPVTRRVLVRHALEHVVDGRLL